MTNEEEKHGFGVVAKRSGLTNRGIVVPNSSVNKDVKFNAKVATPRENVNYRAQIPLDAKAVLRLEEIGNRTTLDAAHSGGRPRGSKTHKNTESNKSLWPAGGPESSRRKSEKMKTELLARARSIRSANNLDISDLRCGCRWGDDTCPDKLHVCRAFNCMAVHSHKTRSAGKAGSSTSSGLSPEPSKKFPTGAERRIKQGADKEMRQAGLKPGGGFRLCSHGRLPIPCSLCRETTDRYHCHQADAVNPVLADDYDPAYNSELEGMAEHLEDHPTDATAASRMVSYLNSKEHTAEDDATLAMLSFPCGARGLRSAYSDIYFETQVDDHCVIHAFNNAMQSPEITMPHFAQHCRERAPGSGFSLLDLTNYTVRFAPYAQNQYAERDCTRESLELAIQELTLHRHAFLILVGQLQTRQLGHAVSVVHVDGHTILLDSTAAPRACDQAATLALLAEFAGLAFCYYIVDTAHHPPPIRRIRHAPDGVPLPVRRDLRVRCDGCQGMFSNNHTLRAHRVITADLCHLWEGDDVRSTISNSEFDFNPANPEQISVRSTDQSIDTASGTGLRRDNLHSSSAEMAAPSLPHRTPSLLRRAAKCLQRRPAGTSVHSDLTYSTSSKSFSAMSGIRPGDPSHRSPPTTANGRGPRPPHLPAHHDPEIEPYTLFFQGHGARSVSFMNSLVHAFLEATVPFTYADVAYVSGITHNLLIHPLMTSFSSYERSLIFGSPNPNAVFHELLHVTSTYKEDFKYLADALRFDRCVEEYVHMPTLMHITTHNSLLSPVAYNVSSRTFSPAMMARLENAAITPSPPPGVQGVAPTVAPGYNLKLRNLTVFNNTIYAAHNYFVFKNVLQSMYMPSKSGISATSSVHETFRAGARPIRLEYQDREDPKPISTVPFKILRGSEHADQATGLPAFNTTNLLCADHSYSTLFGWNFTHTGIVLRLSNSNLRYALRRVLGLRENDLAYDDMMRAYQSAYVPSATLVFSRVYQEAVESAFQAYTSRLDLLAEAVLEPHPKRKLRIQAYEELTRDGSLAAPNHGCYRLTAKLKRFEYAKKGKNGRITADYGVAASLVSFMLFKIIKQMQASTPFVYNDNEARHILSASPTDLSNAYNFIYDYSTTCTRMVYFSDDSVLRARFADGVIRYYNMDISSCDRSHTPSVINLLYSLVPVRLHPELRETIKQLSFPFDVFNVNNRREKIRYKLGRPFMFSGWTGTTALNNVGSLLIFLAACDTLQTAITLDELVAGIRTRSGYDVTLDEHRTYADYQFLKHSPEYGQDGNVYQVLNFGTVLRASGVCRGDLPGSGDTEARARSFQSALMSGLQSGYDNPVISALRSSCSGAPALGTQALQSLKDQHSHWETPHKIRVKLTTTAFQLRYDATTDEIAELVHSIKINVFNCSYSSSLVDRIMRRDYEYDPPAPSDYAAGSMVSLDG